MSFDIIFDSGVNQGLTTAHILTITSMLLANKKRFFKKLNKTIFLITLKQKNLLYIPF